MLRPFSGHVGPQLTLNFSLALRAADPLVGWAVAKEDLALQAGVAVHRVFFDWEALDEGHLACEVSSQLLLLIANKVRVVEFSAYQPFTCEREQVRFHLSIGNPCQIEQFLARNAPRWYVGECGALTAPKERNASDRRNRYFFAICE